MPVSITHVIGTVALLGMLIAVGFAFSLISSVIEADLMKGQLGDVAEYVALNLGEVISLVDASNYPGVTMTKAIELPETISGKSYNIMLLNQTGLGCYVQASMVSRPDVYARSLIPLNITGSGVWLRDETVQDEPWWPTPLGGTVIPTNGTSAGFRYLVWAHWQTEIEAGLGREKPSAG